MSGHRAARDLTRVALLIVAGCVGALGLSAAPLAGTAAADCGETCGPTLIGTPLHIGNALGLAFSSDGSLLAAADQLNNQVDVYSAPTNPLSYAAAPSPAFGSPLTAGDSPVGVAFVPSDPSVTGEARVLAVPNYDDDNLAVYFSAQPQSGLSQPGNFAQAPDSPFTTGSHPAAVAVSPDGSLLATANKGDGTISVFSVHLPVAGALGGTGPALVPLPDSPFKVASPTSATSTPDALRFSPNGDFLAVASQATNSISMFSVTEGATPSVSELPDSPFTAPPGPVSLSFNPAGTLLAASVAGGGPNGDGGVAVFQVDGAGNLTYVNTFVVDPITPPYTGGVDYTLPPTDAQFSPGGQLLAAANPGPSAFPSLATTSVMSVSSSGNLATVGYTVSLPEPNVIAWSPQNSAQGGVYAVGGGGYVAMYSAGPYPTITTPASGATYNLDQSVDADYSCAALATITSCSGTVADGQPLDTSTVGTHTFTVTATDSDGHSVTADDSYTVTGCVGELAFELTHVTGCLTPQSDGTYTATSEIHVNGVPLTPIAGHSIVITPGNGTGVHPGGEIGVDDVSIALGTLMIYQGAINADLPAGGEGDEGSVVTLAPSSNVSLFGFQLGGAFTLNLGRDGDGNYYSSFTLTVDLPNVLKTADGAGGVTGTGSVRVDDNGTVEYNGVNISASNLSIGPLDIPEVCFSLIPGGTTDVDQCQPPSLPGSFTGSSNYLSCQSSPAPGDHWAATAEITLPTPTKASLAVFGAGAGTDFTDLGAIGTNLDIPIAEGVDINTLAAGICFPTAAQPLTIRGDLGVGLFPVDGNNLVTIDGTVIYTNSTPWTLQVGGAIDIDQVGQIATGNVEVYGDGTFTFAANLNLVVGPSDANLSLQGGVNGWVEPQDSLFDLEGNVNVCVAVFGASGCAGADGVVSSTGAAGCIDFNVFGTSLGFGAGYTWSDKVVTPLAGTCDVGPWRATMAASDAAAGSRTLTVAPGTRGIAFRVFGKTAPPSIKVTGPGETQITSPAKGGLVKGRNYLLLESGQNNTTNVGIAAPRAGTYTITALDPSNPITGLQTAPVLAPFSGHGRVTTASHGRRTLRLRYVLPTGSKLTLVELGKQAEHTIAARVRGKACPGASAHVTGGSALCFTKTFTPTHGPGGTRKIYAVIAAHGIPSAVKQVAKYGAPAQTPPSKPAKLQLRRSGTTVTIVWSGAISTSKYGVSAMISEGRTESFFVGPACRAVKLTGIANTESVTAGVAGIRYDGVRGKLASGRLKAGKSLGGTGGRKLAGKLCS